MQEETERLTGTVETVTYQNPDNGFAVLQLTDENGELICVVGPLAGCVPGEELILDGNYIEHRTYGVQFEATACIYQMPENEGAILKYLSSGVIPGIGASTARRIVEKFGERALEILASEPERLAEVKGFSQAKAKAAGQRFLEIYGIREAMASLARLGLTAAEAVSVYRQYEGATMKVVSRNPYILCGYPLMMSFFRADAIAEQYSIGRESPERARAALIYTLRHNLQNGHTCLPRKRLLDTASSFFGIDPEYAELQLEALGELGQAQQMESEGRMYVYLPEILRAEMTAALTIREMAGRKYEPPSNLEKLIQLREMAEGLKYAPLQKEAIAEALTNGAMVVTGGPGTGKTTTVNGIIALLEQQAERVLLAAPTGRAAKRLAELTGKKASTIHRMLEVSYGQGSDIPRFNRNEGNPLKCDVLIVDEMSMVDAMLFESLLAALRPGSRLIMVGDADQLPSVGPGNVLKGILESGVVPVVALSDIFRQAAASLIVSNAHRIVIGQMPEKGGKDDDYFFLRSTGTACQKLLCEVAAQRLPASYELSPFSDIQILCPGRKGMLGTEVLCARMQEILNPPMAGKAEISRGGITYRVGDKVMQVKNNYDIPYTRTDGEPGAGAYNGDIGLIEEIIPSTGSVTVLCEDRHVYYTLETLHELELAYAVTIHKSQGSEFEAVIIPVAEVPKKLRYRNLLYTGVTRAKKLCVLLGEEEVVLQMVQNDKRNIRYSCFAGFLKDEDFI